MDAVQLLLQLLQTTKDRTTQRILAEAYLILGETEQSLHSRAAACEAFRQADRHYRDSGPERTGNDEVQIAKAAREVAACRSVELKPAAIRLRAFASYGETIPPG